MELYIHTKIPNPFAADGEIQEPLKHYFLDLQLKSTAGKMNSAVKAPASLG